MIISDVIQASSGSDSSAGAAFVGIVVGLGVRLLLIWAVRRFARVRSAVVAVGLFFLFVTPLALMASFGLISTSTAIIATVAGVTSFLLSPRLDRWREGRVERVAKKERERDGHTLIDFAETENERRHVASRKILLGVMAPMAVLFVGFAFLVAAEEPSELEAWVITQPSECRMLATTSEVVARDPRSYDLTDPSVAFEIRERERSNCPVRESLSTVRYYEHNGTYFVDVPENNDTVGAVLMGVVAALCAGFVVTNLWVVAKVRRRARAAQAR